MIGIVQFDGPDQLFERRCAARRLAHWQQRYAPLTCVARWCGWSCTRGRIATEIIENALLLPMQTVGVFHLATPQRALMR